MLLARALWRSVCREAALWRSFCWLGAPWRSSIGKLLLARSTVVESHREAFAGGSAAAKVLNGRGHCGRDLSGRSCWPGAAKYGKEGGALRWGPCAWGTQRWGRWAGAESLKPPVGNPARGNPCWVTSVGDPALGNKGVLGASGLYLNQLRGFCFVVPCQSSK